MDIFVAILTLAVLIFVHELGHFLLAKWNNVGVTDFAIGFGKVLWKKKWGETTYSLRLIPLGGYVRMIGDDPRIMQALREEEGGGSLDSTLIEPATNLEDVDPELLKDRNRWFLEKGYWAKFAIVLAGPAFNILFAFFLGIATYKVFEAKRDIDLPVIGGLLEGFPADKAGLIENDRILEVDGVAVSTWFEMADKIGRSDGGELNLLIQREVDGAEAKEFPLVIKGEQIDAELAYISGADGSKFKIGIQPTQEAIAVGWADAVYYSTKNIIFITKTTVKGIWGMVSGIVSPTNIGGPIEIVKVMSQSAERGPQSLLPFAIFLSISLAILNLLPIPVLDGGHLVFFTIEALKGSPLSLRFQERASQVGMLLLLALMVFAVGNDIDRLWKGSSKASPESTAEKE